MKAFVIATLFVVSCTASYHHGVISTQFQAQDGHGGYSYGYSDPLSTKKETKSHDGSLQGGYSYVDAHGHTQSVKYIADPHNGFQIVSATNLPKGPAPLYAAPAASHWDVPSYAHGAPLPVQKTAEVLAAEHAHFAAVAEAKARVHYHHKRSIYDIAPAPVNGVPQETAEVQHEKAKHFAAVHRALANAPAPSHYAPAPVHYAPAPVHYSSGPSHYAQAPAHYAQAPAHYAPAHYGGPAKAAYYPAPAPVNGVPQETAEVQHLKAARLSVLAELNAKAAHSPSYNGQEDDGSYDPRRYETENYH